MTTDQRSFVDLLYRVSREVAAALELQAVLQRVLFAAINNVGGERASIVVLDDNLKPVESAIVYGKNIYEQTTQQLRDTVERGLAGWVVTNRKGALAADTSKDDRWLRREDDAHNRSGAKAAICVPLIARDQLVGTLTLVHSVPGTFTNDHLELMQAIADQAGVAVLNARLYAESQRQARVMGALVQSAASINASLRLDEVFQNVLTQTQAALQVEVAAIALVDNNDLLYRAAVGRNAERLVGRRLQYGQGTVSDVVRTGRGVVVNVPRQTAPFREGSEEIIVRAFAAAPVIANGKSLGVILAVNPTAKTFDPDVLTLLTGLGNLAGTALQNAVLFERLDAVQKRYRELFEDNIDPIIITDIHRKVIEINLRVTDLSGYTPDDLRGRSLDDLIDSKNGKAPDDVTAVTLLATDTFESDLRRKDGSPLPVEVHVRKVVFDDSESLQWILRDISARQELDSLRNDLTAMIYHDLRSPLTNVVSSLDVMETLFTPAETETVASLMGIARHNIDRIRRLIDSLLDINKLESGEAIANRAPFALHLFTEDLLKATQSRAEARQQALQVEIPSDLPLVSVDHDMIRRVLINLVENALKYTPDGGHIAVGAAREGELVRVWVQDDGPGIPAAERERIFDKFARLKGHRSIQGLGIGLAFCRLAVAGHGGKIWVEPVSAQGSRFVFTLPVSAE